MISEEKQDLAVEYALGMMDAASQRAFEAELASDDELRAFAMELRESAATLAHDAPSHQPPPELRERIIGRVRGELAVAAVAAAAARPENPSADRPPSKGSSPIGFVPWAIAAGLAITTAAFWQERNQWKSEALELRNEAIALRQRDVLSQMKIATLSAQNDTFSKASAVVVWDGAKQRGVIKLSNFPAAGAGKDYQLWVVDTKKTPTGDDKVVSGGVIRIGADGVARTLFSPDQPISKAEKFAISIEQEGGVPKSAGPIVLVGD